MARIKCTRIHVRLGIPILIHLKKLGEILVARVVTRLDDSTRSTEIGVKSSPAFGTETITAEHPAVALAMNGASVVISFLDLKQRRSW